MTTTAADRHDRTSPESTGSESTGDSAPPASGVRSVRGLVPTEVPESVPPGRIVPPLAGAPQPPIRGRRLNTNRSWPPSPSMTADYPRVEPPPPRSEPVVEARDSEPGSNELANAGNARRRRRIAYVALAVITLLGLAELISLSAS